MTSTNEGKSQQLQDEIRKSITIEEQSARAFLRDRFLHLISSVNGEKEETSVIRMYDNTEVTCNLKAFDLNFENVIVENLQTPLPQPIKSAILRTRDIISISHK